MPYDFKEANNIVDWPTQISELAFESVPADKIGYDITGNGSEVFVEGWQYRNNNLLFLFDRNRSTEALVLDTNLASAIRVALGLTATSPIMIQDVMGLVTLTAHHVATLTGLEYFTNLQRLDLGDSTFSDVSNLALLTKLTHISLRDNPNLTDISPLLDLPNLKVLNILDIDPDRETSINANLLHQAGVTVLDNQGLFGDCLRHCVLTISQPLPGTDTISLNAYLRFNSFTNEYTVLIGLPEGTPSLSEVPTEITFRYSMATLEVLDLTVVPTIIGNKTAYLAINNTITIEVDSAESEPYLVGFCDNWLPAVGDPDLPTVVFSDEKFEDAVQRDLYLEYTEPVQLFWWQQLRHLDIAEQEVSDIAEIEYAVNLETLKAAFNAFSDTTPLNGLVNLTYLDLLNCRSVASISTAVLDRCAYANLSGCVITEPEAAAVVEMQAHGAVVDLDQTYQEDFVLTKVSGGSLATVTARITATYSRRARSFSGLLELDTATTSAGLYRTEDDEPIVTYIGSLTPILVSPATVSANNTPIQLTIVDHGFEVGVEQHVIVSPTSAHVEIADNKAFTINVVNSSTLDLLGTMPHDTDEEEEGGLYYTQCSLTHDLLAQLPDEFYLQATLPDGSIFKYEFEFAALPVVAFGIVDSTLTGENEFMNSRGLVDASNTEPIVIEIEEGQSGLDVTTRAIVDGVNGNIAANGVFDLVQLTERTYQLVDSIGNGEYSSGGGVTPLPCSLEATVTTRLVRNPFLDRILYELTINNALYDMSTYVQIENQDSTQLIELDADVEVAQYTLIQEEAYYFARIPVINEYPTQPVIRIYTAAYDFGAVSSPADNLYAGVVAPFDVEVKLVTSFEVDGFELDDLTITIPATITNPIVVGPIQSIFNTLDTVDGVQYSDLVRLQFASRVIGSTPIAGDIKIAALSLGEA